MTQNLRLVTSDASSADDIIVSDFSNIEYSDAFERFRYCDSSSESLEYEDRKARLLSLLDSMACGTPSWDGEVDIVSEESAKTARRFLKALPPNRELPKIAPDGEGDVLFVWEPPHGNCIITVQRDLLHLVDHPGSPYAAHVDEQMFTGYRMPVSVLHAIPLR
jgi:hypothetical protein